MHNRDCPCALSVVGKPYAVPRRPLSDAEIAAFRERLVKVATRLFATHGYEGVTMRSVADALGVSPMTSYRYVADKEQLIDLVRTAAFRRLADVQQRVVAHNLPPDKRVRALGRAYIDFALRHPDAYRIMYELNQPQASSSQLEAEVKRSSSFLHDAITELVRMGAVRGDALSLAHLVWAATHGLVSLHLAQKLTNGRDIHELSESLSRLVQRALALPATPTAPARSRRRKA
jgi:AcrR family transcriptional regulator